MPLLPLRDAGWGKSFKHRKKNPRPWHPSPVSCRTLLVIDRTPTTYIASDPAFKVVEHLAWIFSCKSMFYTKSVIGQAIFTIVYMKDFFFVLWIYACCSWPFWFKAGFELGSPLEAVDLACMRWGSFLIAQSYHRMGGHLQSFTTSEHCSVVIEWPRVAAV